MIRTLQKSINYRCHHLPIFRGAAFSTKREGGWAVRKVKLLGPHICEGRVANASLGTAAMQVFKKVGQERLSPPIPHKRCPRGIRRSGWLGRGPVDDRESSHGPQPLYKVFHAGILAVVWQ